MLLRQAAAMIDEHIPVEGNVLNILSLFKEEMGYFWCGLYLRCEDGNLGLGPFCGLPACTKITLGKGVCGTAAFKRQTQMVPDVSLFPGYIACHAETASEIVVPGILRGRAWFVLDVDSVEINYFDATDQLYLEQLAKLIADLYYRTARACTIQSLLQREFFPIHDEQPQD